MPRGSTDHRLEYYAQPMLKGSTDYRWEHVVRRMSKEPTDHWLEYAVRKSRKVQASMGRNSSTPAPGNHLSG